MKVEIIWTPMIFKFLNQDFRKASGVKKQRAQELTAKEADNLNKRNNSTSMNSKNSAVITKTVQITLWMAMMIFDFKFIS